MAAPRELDLTVTLDAAWQAWSMHLYARVTADVMSPGTVRGYLAYARKAVDHLGPQRTCDSVEADEIDAWVGTYRARGCGPATLRFCHKGFGGLLAYAESRRWLRENPMRDVARVPLPAKPPGPERAALTGPEREAMIAAARAGHGTPVRGNVAEWMRDEAVIRLAAESGLRNADICNLDLGDLERLPSGDWVVQIRRGKGRKARTTPITDACARLLLDYVADHRPPSGVAPDRRDKHGALRKGDRDALLLTGRGCRLQATTVCRIVDRLAQAALGRHYIPHGLRHTAGTLLMREAKADVATVAHVLGHSDVSVTSRYLDTSADEAAAAINRRRTDSRSRAPKDLPPGPAEGRWPECGTRNGWNRHCREKTPKCGPCRMWNRRQTEAREQLAALMPQRVHGTVEGYRDWRCRCQACCDTARPRVGLVKREEPARASLGVLAARRREQRADQGVRPRGVCPGCGELRALTLGTGGMRRHGDCPGNGRLPQPPVGAEEPARLRPVVGSAGERLLHRLMQVAAPEEEAS